MEAVAFSVLLNILLLATFLGAVQLPGWAIGLGWLVAAAWWAHATWRSSGSAQIGAPDAGHNDLDLFLRAQAEYLKGHWFEAESLLHELLAAGSSDADAALMLATLYRRTGRSGEAARQLAHLQRMDGADKWVLEAARERMLLQRPLVGAEAGEEPRQAA